MTVTARQNKLLISEDWKKVYQSFRNADFQSYDFENLRRTMIDYIRQNYPEDYNDYIESSEYLALIDLLAFLGQSIAFRVDLNARDNFLELAERRESVLRLARMLSYNAKRNVAASGLLKFTTVSTTENVLDSNGRNLSGQIISWNDPSNANWYDQFIKVINSALPKTQQFGTPTASDTIYGIPTEQYTFQSNTSGVPVFGFSKVVAGRSMDFEVVSTTFKGQTYIYEEAPKQGAPVSCIYRDDGRGQGSAGSGFFMRFVQGTLNTGSFTITQPSNNQSIDIDSQNINNNDIWLYKLDSSGNETESWTSVSNFEANNIIYNSVNKNIRTIFSVITRANDAISLQFSDGTFGDLPLGIFRTYYRVSNGLTYTINTQDVRSINITLPYISSVGQQETISITMNLATSVSNATGPESSDDIKSNAPATYYTQNRMITGEDYNISPLSASTQVAKIKSLNRTSSGISRYFDLSDPTGKYSSTTLFSDDGILYKEEFENSFRFSYQNKTDIEGIIINDVIDTIKNIDLRNFYYEKFLNFVSGLDAVWYNITSDTGFSTGYLASATGSSIYKLGSYTSTDLKYVKPGALIRFTAPTGWYFNTLDNNNLVFGSETANGAAKSLWAEVVGVVDDGTAAGTGTLSTGFGPITLNRTIPSLSSNSGIHPLITQVIPRWRTVIDSSTITTMIDLIFSNKPFGLRYDAETQQWKIIFEFNLDSKNAFSLGKAGDQTNLRQDASWLLLFTTDNEYYTVVSRCQQYIFESASKTRFYFDSSNKIYDSKSNAVIKDLINVLSINTQPNSALPFTYDQPWDIVSEFTGIDGYVDTKKLIVSFADSDDNGVVDNPELFLNIISPPAVGETNSTVLQKKYIIQEKYDISQGQEDYRYFDNSNETVLIKASKSFVSFDERITGQYFYFVNSNTVFKYNELLADPYVPTLDYKVFIGRDNIKFQYIHNADYDSRIDPGVSNIIDVYLLTKGYDTKFRQWLSGALTTKPLPASSLELYDLVSPTLNLIKSISDEIIYHPAHYKILFGTAATPDLQASFKVIKTAGQVISDNDIKTRIIAAIEEFFALENWDFGDTFYFAELSAYVMSQLSPNISSFVIVPRLSGLGFGSLFEIKSSSDELFVNGASVDDIEITTGITSSSIKSVAGTTTQSTTSSQQNTTSSSYGVSNGG
jgi:hypothetical protein